MTTIRLTAKTVEKAKPPQTGRTEYWDQLLPGFGLRITPSGHKSWCLMYRHHGRQRRMTLGRYPALSLERARAEARNALELAQTGKDPIEATEKAQARRSDSVQVVGELFIEKHCKPNNKSWQNQQRRLERHVYPHWKTRQIGEITKRDVVLLLEKVAHESGPFAAEDTLKIIRKLLNWAADRDIVDVNPAQHAKAPIRTTSRERVLSDAELSTIWRAADQLGYPFGPYIQILLLTGQRRTEVATMRWDEIQGNIWTLPGAKAKNAREHVIPLSKLVMEILDGCPRWNNGPFVFSTTGGDRPISGYCKYKTQLEETFTEPITDWRLHDLRRSFATGLAKLGFTDDIIARCLNHASNTVTSRYNRHAYLDEKARALEAWANSLRLSDR